MRTSDYQKDPSWQSVPELSPEQKLWRSVILQAVQDACTAAPTKPHIVRPAKPDKKDIAGTIRYERRLEANRKLKKVYVRAVNTINNARFYLTAAHFPGRSQVCAMAGVNEHYVVRQARENIDTLAEKYRSALSVVYASEGLANAAP